MEDRLKECECKKKTKLSDVPSHFVEIKVDSINWQTLYECPITKILWKEYFSYPYAQAGGPPHYIQISRDQAEKEFNIKLT